MPDIFWILAGAIAGGLGAWTWLSRRMRDQLQAELAEAARKATRAVDWARSEAAMQLERRDQEIHVLRAKLDEREHSVEQVRSRLQADLALAHRERSQWESKTTDLSLHAEGLAGQLRSVAAEGHRDLDRLRAIARDLEAAVKDFGSVLDGMDARLRPAGGRSPVGPLRRPAP